MLWLPVLGIFNVCEQMLMHAIAHEGCSDTVRESAPEVNSGKKIATRTGDSNPHQYYTWLFSRTLYQLSYPGPYETAVYVVLLGDRGLAEG